jgi:ADP-ribosylation factor protein 1
MGINVSKLYNSILGKKELRVPMVGLDSAGKTSILYQLRFGSIDNLIPTIGYGVETIIYEGINFNVLEVGGSNQVRILWKHFYKNAHGLIFVIDSSDSERIDEAVKEFKILINEEELIGKPILVFTNKQDLEIVMKPEEIIERLGLKEIEGIQWFVQGTSAKTGDGLKEGIKWLTGVLN